MTFKEWKQFLASQGINNNSNSTIAGKSSSIITPLLHQGLLKVSGADAAKFLQGQLTCNVTMASDGNSIPGAACNPQGRMYSSFQLLPAGDSDEGFFLRMREDIIESTVTNLSKYIVFFKAKATNESTRYAGIGISGKQSSDCIARIFGQVPSDDNQLINIDRAMIVKLPGQPTRYECWLPIENARNYWQQLTETAVTGSVNDWLIADIANGIGEVSLAVSETFIPQMLNYDKNGAISFNKGCYTGQEVVARLQYRGKSKRAMAKLSLKGDPKLEPGHALHLPGKEQNIATIVTAAMDPSAGKSSQHALAVISAELISRDAIELCLKDSCFTAQITTFPADIIKG